MAQDPKAKYEAKQESGAERERAKRRFELACAAISGLALHQLDKPVNQARAAVALADQVLDALDGVSKDVPFVGRAVGS